MSSIDTRLYDLEKSIPAILRDQMDNIFAAGKAIHARKQAAIEFTKTSNTETKKVLLEYIDACNKSIREVFGL